MKGGIRVKFFDFSASREYLLQPDIVEYDTEAMIKLGFDRIVGSNSMKEIGNVLNFQTKETTLDKISLPMRDINKLKR